MNAAVSPPLSYRVRHGAARGRYTSIFVAIVPHARIAAIAIILTVTVAAACASVLHTGTADRLLPVGDWGGEHIALTVTAAGGHFEFDCASGDILRPMKVDASGRFSMDGVFVPERPGAQRFGEIPDRKPARYTGRLDDSTLTFDVTLTESKTTMGSFSVTRDATARVRKCR